MSVDPDTQDDPYAMFKVRPHVCDVLDIRVMEGRNISKGILGDFLDTPDPYIRVNIPIAAEPIQQTRAIDNDPNPHWFDNLRYYLLTNPTEATIAQISLMDANYTADECLGTVEFDVNNIKIGSKVIKTFKFNKKSEVDIQFKREVNKEYDLRYSLALSGEEKRFRDKRRRKAMVKMRELLKEQAPMNIRETPCIAVMGSGGGYRAAVGFGGAVSALQEIGVLDCATYTVGLSGSTWFMSSLYSHPSFPENGVDYAIKDMRKHLKSNLYDLLKPMYGSLYRYINVIKEKRRSGQPVTLTDLFGLVIGEHLIGPERIESARLSDFATKIEDGEAPMPLMTCLYVQPDVSAQVYHEWMEFSPYEIGMAKYGTFVRTKDFNNRFFMGVVSKKYEESPLHFLMGVWGSAFSILFHRLKGRNDNDGERHTGKCLQREMTLLRGRKLSELGCDEEDDDEEEHDEEDECNEAFKEKEEKSTDPWSIKSIIFNALLKSRSFCRREYRAGRILNFMRGLEVTSSYPLSPFTETSTGTTFSRLAETISSVKKRVCVVDAGLAFNSPYPAVLRPQRFVDLILSFDFSAREKDHMDPFAELLLAEKWARLHNIPFPKIDTDVYKREGLKELYIFKDEDNPRAPIILHFCLCNVQYRGFKTPNVPRETSDTSGNFDIFTDDNSPFSTFEFQYDNENFDRLHDLVKFNTLLNKDKILEVIADCVRLRKTHKNRYMVPIADVRRSANLDEERKKMYIERFLSKFRSLATE